MTLTGRLDLTEGRPAGLLVRFALPMLLGNLLQQLYNVVDSLVVGNFVGTQALAAVNIGNYPVNVLLALFIGMGTGASIRISQCCGAGDEAGVRRLVDSAMSLILLLSLPLTLLGLAVARPVLSLMNTPADSFEAARQYLSIFLLGTLGLLGYNLNAGILRGMGDSRSSVLFLAVATVVNIALDLLFVAGLGWGVSGAAAATVIAVYASWAFSLLYIRRHYPQFAMRFYPLRIDGRAVRDILRLGLPIGINDALFSLGHLILSSIVNTHGSAFVAGYSAAGKLDTLSFMPLSSFAAAATAFTGQNFGARRFDRVRSGARSALLLVVGWSFLACGVLLLCGRWAIGLFDRTPEVIDVGYAYLLCLEPFYVLYSIMYLLNAVMNGVGCVRVPMIANMVLFWVVRLPAAYLLNALAPANALFFCYPISWAAGLAISGLYFLSGRWRRGFAKEETA